MANLYVSPAGYDNYIVIKNGSCSLQGVVVENTSMITLYIQIFDLNRQPTSGDRPIVSLKLSGGGQESFDTQTFNNQMVINGLCVASSTTGSYYTDPGSAQIFISAWWY